MRQNSNQAKQSKLTKRIKRFSSKQKMGGGIMNSNSTGALYAGRGIQSAQERPNNAVFPNFYRSDSMNQIDQTMQSQAPHIQQNLSAERQQSFMPAAPSVYMQRGGQPQPFQQTSLQQVSILEQNQRSGFRAQEQMSSQSMSPERMGFKNPPDFNNRSRFVGSNQQMRQGRNQFGTGHPAEMEYMVNNYLGPQPQPQLQDSMYGHTMQAGQQPAWQQMNQTVRSFDQNRSYGSLGIAPVQPFSQTAYNHNQQNMAGQQYQVQGAGTGAGGMQIPQTMSPPISAKKGRPPLSGGNSMFHSTGNLLRPTGKNGGPGMISEFHHNMDPSGGSAQGHQTVNIHQNNLNINLGKLLPNSVKDLGLGGNQQGVSEKDLMDLYVKCLSTQVENADLKDKNKLDNIEITRLRRQLKQRDKLISQYLPEHNEFLNQLRVQQMSDDEQIDQMDPMMGNNLTDQFKYLKSREDFFRSQMPKNKQSDALDFLSRDVLHNRQTMGNFNTYRLKKQTNRISKSVKSQQKGKNNIATTKLQDKSDDKDEKQSLMSAEAPFDQKKKEMSKIKRKDGTQRKLPPKPIHGKPMEFHEKAIVISLKSVIQEQKDYIENQKMKFQRRIKDLKQAYDEVALERDAVFDQCKNLNKLIEDFKKAKETEEAIGPLDDMSPDQVRTYIQNLKQNNRMLDKENRTLQLHTIHLEDGFKELRGFTKKLQDCLRYWMNQLNTARELLRLKEQQRAVDADPKQLNSQETTKSINQQHNQYQSQQQSLNNPQMEIANSHLQQNTNQSQIATGLAGATSLTTQQQHLGPFGQTDMHGGPHSMQTQLTEPMIDSSNKSKIDELQERTKMQIDQIQNQIDNHAKRDMFGDDGTAKNFLKNLTQLVGLIQDSIREIKLKTIGQVATDKQNQEIAQLSREQLANEKMQMSFMKRQMQQDCLGKVKRIIQNQILKNGDRFEKQMTAEFAAQDGGDRDQEGGGGATQAITSGQQKQSKDVSWDTDQMRQIIRSQIPLGDIVLDDEFFESQQMKDFKPVPSMTAVIEPCQNLMKLIQKDLDNKNNIDNSIFNMTSQSNAIQLIQGSFQAPKMAQSGEKVHVFKIQKLRQKLLKIHEVNLQKSQQITEYNKEQIEEDDEGTVFFKTLGPLQQKQLIDFVDFLADKTLSSDQYLSISMLQQICQQGPQGGNSPRLFDGDDIIDESNKLNFHQNTEESIKKLQDPSNKRNFNCLIQCLLQGQAFEQFFDYEERIIGADYEGETQQKLERIQAQNQQQEAPPVTKYDIQIIDAKTFKNVVWTTLDRLANSDDRQNAMSRDSLSLKNPQAANFLNQPKQKKEEIINQFIDILRCTPNDLAYMESLGRNQLMYVDWRVNFQKNQVFQNLLNLKYLKKFCKSRKPSTVSDIRSNNPEFAMASQFEPQTPKQRATQSPVINALRQHLLKIGIISWLGSAKRQVQIKKKVNRQQQQMQVAHQQQMGESGCTKEQPVTGSMEKPLEIVGQADLMQRIDELIEQNVFSAAVLLQQSDNVEEAMPPMVQGAGADLQAASDTAAILPPLPDLADCREQVMKDVQDNLIDGCMLNSEAVLISRLINNLQFVNQ